MNYEVMLKSCEIFVKYNLTDYLEADHDIIFGPVIGAKFSDEDEKKLKELGWDKSDEYDCWCHHC